MKRGAISTALILLFSCGVAAQEVSTFPAYVDSDLCARLMLGPITPDRVQCSQTTFKDGSLPVLVRLRNNMVLSVNNGKMIRPLVGQLAEISGKVKANDGTVKLASAMPTTEASIPRGDPARNLLDAGTYRTDHDAQLHEKIRHELAMMPYISVFDFISFTQNGSDVILTGWTVRATNRDDAGRSVRDVDGVTSVVNNIEIVPLGSFDMQIRASARAALQRFLGRYFWGNGSDIKIVVKNGQIILLGTVATKADSDIAFIQCNSVPGSFKVFNMLRVQQDSKTKEK
jgi:hyperosmotically inducible protein